VNLLITYFVTTLIGQSIAVGVGILADVYFSSFISLLVFFPLFFGMFWVAWRLSVKLTEPKPGADGSSVAH
jgi:hypothetical protein